MEKGHRDFECLNPFDTHDHSHFFFGTKGAMGVVQLYSDKTPEIEIQLDGGQNGMDWKAT